ncbi:MAG: hypothetical protein KDH20_19810 [Rhodocyclaceae bacterium]|nr:hypothetical protein [Rhodocyclaceae bacterium]
MHDGTEISESELAGMIERVDAKAQQLRTCLGALQVARAPERERLAVNRAIGFLARIKIHLRSGHNCMHLCEERAVTNIPTANRNELEARVKHAALALLNAELRDLEAAGVQVIHEFNVTPA